MEPVRAAKSPNVRVSTDEDAQEIHRWLAQQQADGVAGTFLCNWNLTQQAHEEGELLVYVNAGNGKPVAYQWGGLVRLAFLKCAAISAASADEKALSSKYTPASARVKYHVSMDQTPPGDLLRRPQHSEHVCHDAGQHSVLDQFAALRA